MAAKVTPKNVNWGLISEYLSPETRNAFGAFKAQYDKYQRDISELPSELPKIDWASYKSKITSANVVDSFQKNYESLKIPYPSDQGWVSKVEANGQKRSADFEKVRQEGLKTIAKLKEQLKELEKEVPFSEATMEEIFLMRPEFRIDPDKPKLWPQFLDFEDKEDTPSKH